MATVTSFPLETVPFTADFMTPVFEAHGIITITEDRFGARLTGQDPSERLVAIQAAFDYGAANGVTVYIPEGVWVIDAELFIPSNAHIRGAGKTKTIIKMDDSVGARVDVFRFGAEDDPRENITIEDLTVDANAARWASITGEGGGIALKVYNTQHATFNRVHVKGAINHGFDIGAAIHPDFGWTTGEYGYLDTSSKYITLNECSAEGCGDDNMVTHHSSWVWFNKCRSHDPGGPGKGNSNSNCWEIDDGSRNIYLTDCLAERGNNAIQIKAHGGGPAPYNVNALNFTSVNCALGVHLRHSNSRPESANLSIDEDHEGTTDAIDLNPTTTVWANNTAYSVDDYVTSPTTGNIFRCLVNHTSNASGTLNTDYSDGKWGRCYTDDVLGTKGTIDDGYSPTAYNVKFVNTTIIAPKMPQPWWDAGMNVADLGGIFIQNYSGALFVNTTITDGSEDFGNKEYEAYSYATTSGSPDLGLIRLAVQARRITFRDTFINGFASENLGIVATSTSGDNSGFMDITFDGLLMRNAPRAPVQFHAALGNITINNYFIGGDHIGDGTIGINFGSSDNSLPTKQSNLGFGQVRGYDTLVQWSGLSYTDEDVFAQAKTIVGRTHFLAGTTARAPIRMAAGVAPSSPDATDLWKTSGNLGTITTGTVTLDPRDLAVKYYVNNGAHTLAPAAVDGVTRVLITNDSSAGAITTSAYDVVNGDAFSTTNGHRFLCTSSRINGYKVLTVEALQ